MYRERENIIYIYIERERDRYRYIYIYRDERGEEYVDGGVQEVHEARELLRQVLEYHDDNKYYNKKKKNIKK